MRLLMLASLVALSGCGSSEESTTVAGTTYSSNEKEGTASIKSSDGEVSVVDGAAANKVELPAYAPRYPGATITGIIESKKDGHKSTMVNMESKDQPGAVVKFYREILAKNGMKLKSDLPTDQGGMIAGEGNGKKVAAMIARDEASTGITLSYSDL
jgi:major membrane immunogen (membrane-anchored lipoprotein)